MEGKKQKILEELKKGRTYKEVEAIAEKLIYKLEPLLSNSSFRIRFNALYKKHLKRLGYQVFEIGIKEYEDRKKFEEKLKREGFLYTYNCYFNKTTKEAFSIGEYPGDIYISIDNFLNEGSLPILISLEEYRNLVEEDILEIVNKYKKYRDFVNSLIKEEKRFYERELEEERKNKIIEKALIEAQRKGLIKHKRY